jgi:hypothetical protein
MKRLKRENNNTATMVAHVLSTAQAQSVQKCWKKEDMAIAAQAHYDAKVK